MQNFHILKYKLMVGSDCMLPNVPAKLFSLSAVIVGYILIDDLTANEQNALGNWLMLVAQVLSTNAFYREVRQERGLEAENSTESGQTSNSSNNDYRQNKTNNDKTETIEMLEKMVRAIQNEIDSIKKDL